MAGRRRGGGHRRQARPTIPPPPEEPSTMEPGNLREVAAVESPSKKTCHASSSTSATICVPEVWADLLDSLLLQVIGLLSSFHDLLAFIGTCHSWRAALSSLPPAFSFNFPPLHLRPDIGDPHPHRSSVNNSLLSNCKWQLVDPAKRTSSLHRLAPRNLRGRYLGCSYGYLIFSNLEQCLLVDIYSGATVRPPRLKSTGNHDIYYGFLVAPINSSNSHLLLCSRLSMFQWQVGTSSWLEHRLNCERILQIVFFKGEMLAMDFHERLHRIRLQPQLSVQEVPVAWGDDIVAGHKAKPWLVVSGDMLLLVELSVSRDAFFDFSGTVKVFRLNFSIEPATWVKVDNLGNKALFVSNDMRNPTFSCMNPERWGGKSNCIYGASTSADSDEAWNVVELGQVLPCTLTAVGCSYRREHNLESSVHNNQLQSLWVLPSLVYGIGQ
ncbi:hypothetical protein BAE44_0020837 [Dichanthelium oligosanthes]|uniref:KIB1-4 beta-propeller domain-containing protein n=1 Tax=Dichanthelium oligosanthes TaxID=888268 RepID=A0A1E5UZ09_9POAL|nr:hypothetical protein BAE44_0020837 [Dichanthelium oligosanthes]